MGYAKQKSLLGPQPSSSFAARIRHESGSAAHLIKTYDQQARPCWFLLQANERSLMKLQHTSFDEIINLTKFGAVITAGWGHTPDRETLAKHGFTG